MFLGSLSSNYTVHCYCQKEKGRKKKNGLLFTQRERGEWTRAFFAIPSEKRAVAIKFLKIAGDWSDFWKLHIEHLTPKSGVNI